jgi:transcription elongation GreA/GreB family factor
MNKILREDLVLLDARVEVLQKELFDLGEEFGIAVNQSSETWHDNAPFDFARDKQSLLAAELLKLRTIRRESLKYLPKKTKKIQIGSKVVVRNGRELKVMIGGVWVGREEVDGYKLITCDAPIAHSLIGKSKGDEVRLPTAVAEVLDIK